MDDVYEPGEAPDTKRWYISRLQDASIPGAYPWGIMTPGGHGAALCTNLNDARLIVGELNHVAELREQVEKFSNPKAQAVTMDELEKRIRALIQTIDARPKSPFTNDVTWRQMERLDALEERVEALEQKLAGQN